MNKLPKILIADDSEFNQLYLEQMMTTIECDFKIVGDGKQAVEEVKSGNYNLVIMDVEMPGMDGKEATKMIKQDLQAPLNRIPVVALTAHRDEAMIREIESIGFDDIISKPFEINTIKEMITRYTG
ncbi:MAG: response regulator [Bacteroidales bacterium]|nr:response regulator [Bacteroidales bacterium]